MRYFVLIITLLSLNSLNAQYGTNYQFHFTLRDSTTGFDSTTDEHKVKTSKGGRRLVIKTKDYNYHIYSEAGYSLSAQDGKVTVVYGVIPPRAHLELTIQRRGHGNKAALHLALTYLQKDDFSELHWQQDSLILDLSYQKNLIDYELITPKTAEGHRDLSCFLLAQCPPTWQLTQRGIDKEEARRILKFKRIKYRLDHQVDSLISAHFLNDIFLELFDLECATGYYHANLVPPRNHCEVLVDTSLMGMRQLYKLKAPQLTTPFYLDIHTYEGYGAYFSSHYFGKKRFTRHELNFLPAEEISRFAQEEFPDLDFIADENGQPVATLIYLAEQPRNITENHDYPFELRDIPVKKDTSNWPGTFAYYLQRPLPQVGDLCGYENYYFYAHTTRFIMKTENYYDLLDE
ncbi:hypothetical protein [Lewinella cohaerens]|uniref:hypothetical protein n=1 Tax=Lewinella cohaerens TaxID=70995 RepID=UPI00037491F5|nr:hypothetical protein [Lewinella cohaerens]